MSQKNRKAKDPYIGRTVNGYRLTRKVGEGRIGSVYRAEREAYLADVLACKIIPEGRLKSGWERELEKVLQLRAVPHVVQYHQHGSALDANYRPFIWVLWNYIDGINLSEYIKSRPWPLDMAFVESITQIVLTVLHACKACGIQHGDLHEGNILISKPDPRLPNSPRTVWVSDFGYGGSHNELEPKDDYRQLFAVVSRLLGALDSSSLNPRDRVMHERLGSFLKKRVLELESTQGKYVANPDALLKELVRESVVAERESAAAAKGEDSREPGDYLAAEALGYRVEEWKELFVPDFLAAQNLLSRNVTVMTGARGCGKTMAFRRLTAYMDRVIGAPSGVKGADQFVGFYLNCRDLVEAFPWVPKKLKEGTEQQIIHYFHLAWLSEICRTLAICRSGKDDGFEWLDGFLAGLFKDKYSALPQGADVLTHVSAFLDDEKERCRLVDLGKCTGYDHWPLARADFLDMLQGQMESRVAWIGQKPLYFFLDDYTIPLTTREVQRTLNPIVFKRRQSLFFKVSTEAATSFARAGRHGKPLELHADFELVDLGTESLHQGDAAKIDLLDKVFRPRIDRHDALKRKDLGLEDLLGKTPWSNNELARIMRDETRDRPHERVLYHGVRAFAGMWASDIRVMIQMFADMLRDANGDIRTGTPVVKPAIQDRTYRAAGGEFLVLAESVVDPSIWEGYKPLRKGTETYGEHLKDIVEAFVNVSRYELMEGPMVSNQGKRNPKQAFRIEIVDPFELPAEAHRYYEGLIRWHFFLQDWRGKSVRGMITPRLYLNRLLIPYCTLTFSSHDNIPMTNEEFARLLRRPREFPAYWRDKTRNNDKTGHLFKDN